MVDVCLSYTSWNIILNSSSMPHFGVNPHPLPACARQRGPVCLLWQNCHLSRCTSQNKYELSVLTVMDHLHIIHGNVPHDMFFNEIMFILVVTISFKLK